MTDFLKLSLTDANEVSMTFLEWRQSIDGTNADSNMNLIDGAIKLLSERVDATNSAKADGFTLDEDSGVLQLTSGGVPLDGASVTINLNKYYTKDEVDEFLAELEAMLADNETIYDIHARALGGLTWDEENRALTMYSLNGEVLFNPLIIEGGGGGTGGGGSESYSVRLVNGMSSASFTVASSAETVITATYYEYYGSALTGVAGKMDVKYKLSSMEDAEENWTTLTSMSVEQGVPFNVDVTNILTLGSTTNVRLTVTGGESGSIEGQAVSRSLTYNITQVEASIEAKNFNSAATYRGNFNFEYVCTGRNLSKVVHFEVDGSEIATADIGTSHNESKIQPVELVGLYGYGAHDLAVYFTTPDGAKSNVIRVSFIYDDGSGETYPIIAASPVREEITYGDTLEVTYAVDTPISGQETTDNLNIRVYSEDSDGVQTNYDQRPLENVGDNVLHSYKGTLYPESGIVYIEFTSGANEKSTKTVSVKINEIQTDYDLHMVDTGLVYKYNPAGRSNNDASKELYTCKYAAVNGVTTNIRGVFNGFNWVSNGYIDGESLTLSGEAKHVIELPIFTTTYVDADGQTVNLESNNQDTVTTHGRTIELEFKVDNVTDINAHIIECMSADHAGFVVTPQNCWMLASNGSDVTLDHTGFIENEEGIAAAYLKDGVRIRLSFVIEGLETVSYVNSNGVAMTGQCVNVYINGQYANSFPYPSTYSFTSEEFITMGSETCIVNLYDVRIYNRALSAKDIMQNYCASPLSVQNRLLRFEDNDVLNDDKDVDYEKAIKKYNCLLVTGPLSPYKDAYLSQREDGKYESGLTLTMPDGNGGYRTEFALLDKDANGYWFCANNVQGTSSQKYPIKNYKFYLAKAEASEDGTLSKKKVKYALKGKDSDGNALSVAESTLCWKADYMSSDHANTFNANLADTLFTDKTPAQVTNPLVQNTIYGFRCLLFQRDDENSPIRFAGDGALNNDKGNSKSFGLEDDSDKGNDTKCQKWEFLNNTADICKFKSDMLMSHITINGTDTLAVTEALESCYPDQGDLKDEGLQPNYNYIQTVYTWVNQRANFWNASSETLESPLTYNGAEYTNERDYRKAIFVNEFDRHFNRNHALVYYLFMEFVALCDNRGKNMFLQCFDVRAESLLNVNGEPMSITDAINADGEVDADMIDWENSTFALWYPVLYDLDSCFGVENSGYMWIPYYADWDYGTADAKRFNSYDSIFWLMFEEAMANDIKTEAQRLTSRATGAGGLHYDALYDVHIRNNADFVCTSVINRDMEYKYSDPWVDGFIDYSQEGNPTINDSKYKYMQRGSRTQQKDAFIYRRSNMLYSKYQCDKFLNNKIIFRCGKDMTIEDSYMELTANQVLYPAVRFSDTSSEFLASGGRTEAGETCVVQKPGNSGVGSTDGIHVAGATFLTDIGDISKFYPYDFTLNKATGLRRLVAGSSDENYVNTRLTDVDVSACKILEELNVMGCTALGTIDLSNNGLLKKVYANRSSANSVILPEGGVLEELHLGSIVDLEVIDHSHLNSFSCDSYDSIVSLRVENTPIIPTLDIVTQRLPYLTRGLRLVGVDWDIGDDVTILERLVSAEAQGKYINNNGVLSDDKTAYPQITGTVHINTIGSYLLAELNKIYPDLVVDAAQIIEQYIVEFRNWDGTVLDTQLVLRGSGAVDPVTRAENPIETPTRPSTVSTNYTFDGWDGSFAIISSNTVITAIYAESTREYTVRWLNGTTVLQTKTVLYGQGAEYTGATPTDTSQEDYLIYRLFNGWDKNTYFVDRDIDAYAQFTEAQPPADKTLAEMNPTELYALIKTGVLAPAGTTNTMIASGDTIDITLGRDYEFNGITSYELVPLGTPEVYDGTNYRDTGIKLFDEDKAFTLAIDFQFSEAADTTVIAGCYDANGFTLRYNTNPMVRVGTTGGINVATGTGREMVVIRKSLGDTNLYVYASNRVSTEIIESVIANSITIQHDAPLSFGANIKANGYIDAYAKGTIYWAKLWMADLGAIACRNLATWTRNTLTLQAAGNSEYAFRMFTRADNQLYVNCCFLTKDLLDVYQRMNTTSTNAGGWKDSYLRQWLSTRVYDAIPDQWKLLMALINMNTSDGSNTIKINTTEDYIFVPPCKALGFFTTTTPYVSESEATFDLFVSPSDRVKRLNNGDGAANDWWTASAYYNADSSLGTSSFFQAVDENGSIGRVSPSNSKVGVCFGFCI